MYHLEELSDGALLVGGGTPQGPKVEIHQLWTSLVRLCCLEIAKAHKAENITKLLLPSELSELCLQLRLWLRLDDSSNKSTTVPSL